MELINYINNLENSYVSPNTLKKKLGRPPNPNKIIKVKNPMGRPKKQPLTDEEKLEKLYKLRAYWKLMKSNRKQKGINEGLKEKNEAVLIEQRNAKDMQKIKTLKALN